MCGSLPRQDGRVGHRLVLMALLLGIAGCAASGEARKPPEARYGHRYAGSTPDGRRTLALVPPDTGQAYFYYPAPIDELTIRHAPLAADTGRVPVEVVVKGALPNSCYVLHDVTQRRTGHLLRVTLRMRTPRGAVCRRMVRPYRFYLPLEGRYETGAYTLKINGLVHPFSIRAE